MADDAKGKAKHVGGRLKEEAGELLGDRELEREGRLEQAREARERKREAELRKRQP